MDAAARDRSPFGVALRQARVRAGLSQNALARRAGIDPAYVNRIEAAIKQAQPDITILFVKPQSAETWRRRIEQLAAASDHGGIE